MNKRMLLVLKLVFVEECYFLLAGKSCCQPERFWLSAMTKCLSCTIVDKWLYQRDFSCKVSTFSIVNQTTENWELQVYHCEYSASSDVLSKGSRTSQGNAQNVCKIYHRLIHYTWSLEAFHILPEILKKERSVEGFIIIFLKIICLLKGFYWKNIDKTWNFSFHCIYSQSLLRWYKCWCWILRYPNPNCMH